MFEAVGRHVEGRVYPNLKAKRDEVEAYLDELKAAPERVRSLCCWEWLRESLERLPDRRERHALLEIADFVVSRVR